jgi:hypothetical protein
MLWRRRNALIVVDARLPNYVVPLFVVVAVVDVDASVEHRSMFRTVTRRTLNNRIFV